METEAKRRAMGARLVVETIAVVAAADLIIVLAGAGVLEVMATVTAACWIDLAVATTPDVIAVVTDAACTRFALADTAEVIAVVTDAE